MNTTIEFILYGIGIVMLIAVPLALIAGGLASRSIVVPPETGDDGAAVCVTRKSHLAAGNQTGEPPNGTSPSDSKRP